MVTGDHPATAFAISKTLGIADDPSMVLSGNEINEIGSFEVPEFFDKVEAARVFARVTPDSKTRNRGCSHQDGPFCCRNRGRGE